MTIEVTEVKGKASGPANFPEMPTVGGDPIVESGSNSDGVWTRWADGTQWCGNSNVANLNTSIAAGSIYRAEAQVIWTFPVPFVSNVCAAAQLVDSASLRVPVINGRGLTSAQLNCLGATSSPSGVGVGANVTGRWK